MRRSNPRRAGFTLIELLVVIAIIAILAALIMAAFQTAREAANRVVCANNLRNFAIGCHNHHIVHKRFPTGGWGWNWIGDPDRGTDKSQPGGWGYCLLPFVEQDNIRKMGEGVPAPQQYTIKAQAIAIPMNIYNCPTRRKGGPYPTRYRYYECDPAPNVARTDYAANAGHQRRNEFFGGPRSKAEGDDPDYGSWHLSATQLFTGIFFERSEIKLTDVTRGTGSVYMFGEKYLTPDNYYNGRDGADNETLHTGFNNDVYRVTDEVPIQDRKGFSTTFRYGSAHKTGCNMAFVDQSVRFIPYTIDPTIHRDSGKRY